MDFRRANMDPKTQIATAINLYRDNGGLSEFGPDQRSNVLVGRGGNGRGRFMAIGREI